VTGWVVVADDLTGALDAGAALARGAGCSVLLAPDSPWPEASGLVAVSTRTRDDDPGATADRVKEAVGLALRREAAVLLKIDSLLRGEVGAAVRAGLDVWRARHGSCVAIVAPAFPARGRSTRRGCVEVEGERPSGQRDLAAALAAAGLRSVVVGRGEPLPSVASLLESAEVVDALILDCESDDDLARVAAAYGDSAGVLLVGTAGLAAHLPAPRSHAAGVAMPVGDHALLAIGSLASAAAEQVEAAVRAGIPQVRVGEAPAVAGREARELLGVAHVIVTPGLDIGLADPGTVAGLLAEAVCEAASEADALVLSGGHTAQAVLDRLDVRLLEIVAELEPGVVASRMPGRHQLVVTKAGAFGDASTLLRLLAPSMSSPGGRSAS
jgi:uncharacterized protein YgbK (DUF1537 family)